MRSLLWTPVARAAREDAIDYVAQDNPVAALEQLDEINRQSSLLGEHPLMGRVGRVRGTRELVIQGTPYILVYRVRGGVVQILHLLHGAQQWPPG